MAKFVINWFTCSLDCSLIGSVKVGRFTFSLLSWSALKCVVMLSCSDYLRYEGWGAFCVILFIDFHAHT